MVVVVALLLFAIGLAGTVQIEQDYQEDWFIPEGNYFYDYIQISKQYFQSDGDEAFVFFGKYTRFLGFFQGKRGRREYRKFVLLEV